MLPDRPRISWHRRRRRKRIGQIAPQILPIVRPPQATKGDEIVEQHLAGGRVHPEQPCGLIQMQTQPGHLAERAEHHCDELGADGLGAGAPLLAASIERSGSW
jgi:hypothetical protein